MLKLGETPHKTPATTTATPPTWLLQAGAVSQLLFIQFGAFPPKISTEEPASTGHISPAASLSAPCPDPSLFHAEPRPFPMDVPCPEVGEGDTPCPPALPGGPGPRVVPVGARIRRPWGGSRSWDDPSGTDPSAGTRSCRGDRRDTGHGSGPGEAAGCGDPCVRQPGVGGEHSPD